jgi:hypothetical protein
LSPLHNRHVIGINNAYRIGNWIDVLFFGDCSWYLVHRHPLSKWPGIKVTCCHRFSKRTEKEMENIKYVFRDKEHKNGITTTASAIAWNGNSGAAAISLAVHFGVKRIILLGFDMNVDDADVTHWHGSHKNPSELPKSRVVSTKKKLPPFQRHLRGFPAIAEDARKLGVTILNASPQSAITVFRKVSVKDVLENTKDLAE